MTDYPWIRKIGEYNGSNRDYVEMMVDLARKAGAPQNATYRNSNGTWTTTDQIKSNHFRKQLGLPLWPTRTVVDISFGGVDPSRSESIIKSLEALGFDVRATRREEEIIPDDQ